MTPPAPLDSKTRIAVRRKLLAWFDRAQRTLPWRADRDPYRIWVSEVMLQQTTVAAVVPYFTRFLTAFPTVQALADADEQAVLKLWQGLGYYRRARHLHAAAKQMVVDHGGTFPNDPTVWESLPGVGRYILGAVLSQAFDARLPIVEANSLRVLSRLYGSRLDPREGDGKKWVWTAAEEILPTKRAGDFNQAVMELGALVCTPDTPKCGECPVRAECVAFRTGTHADIPPKAKQKATVEVREVAVVLRKRRAVLLGRRPASASRWANMWELPRGEVQPGEAIELAAVRVAEQLLGLRVAVGAEVATVRHGVTRFAITLTAMSVTAVEEPSSAFYSALEWVEPDHLSDHPMSTPQAKLLAEVTKRGKQKRLF